MGRSLYWGNNEVYKEGEREKAAMTGRVMATVTSCVASCPLFILLKLADGRVLLTASSGAV